MTLPSLSMGLILLWIVLALYGPLKTWISTRLLVRQTRRLLDHPRNGDAPRQVALIVAARGLSPAFDEFLELVTQQDYPAYRLLFVTESSEDPAAKAFRAFLGIDEETECWTPPDATSSLRDVRFITSGLSCNEGQKIHNQRMAFARLTEEDRIVAFADADIVGNRAWLRELVLPLQVGEADLSTGYRWLIPERNTLANVIGSNINASIAMMAGPSWHCLLWGGSMAMTRETFDELDIPELLKGSLNDDLLISRAARRRGKRIIFVRSLLAPSPVDYTWERLFEFARRQYFQVRVYVPRYWITAFVFTSIWLAGTAICWWEVFQGRWNYLIPIGIVGAATGLKTILRGHYLRRQFGPEILERLKEARRLEWPTTTLNFVLHWIMIVSALPIHRITWAGIRYEVRGRNRVKVLART